MRGIILAGGSGTRLLPLTKITSKQLLPVYNRPMIYYPLNTLIKAGIKDILIIIAPERAGDYLNLLGSGKEFGVKFTYEIQDEPKGLAEAFIIGEDFIGNDAVCLILGDNLFYGHGLSERLQKAAKIEEGATIFGYQVKDPERYGVVNFDDTGRAIDIEEKPEQPKSNYAVTGLYFYDNQVIKIAKGLRPSYRGELEITDVNLAYLRQRKLQVEKMGRGMAWLDTGTHHSLLEASMFIETMEKRQGLKVACLEEIAYTMGYIDKEKVRSMAQYYCKTDYGEYLIDLIK